jgi:hypothetical protein
MATLHPNDFESTDGRKKIIGFLHEMDAKIHRLEHALHVHESEETEFKDELKDIVKIEGIEEGDATEGM